MEGRPRRTAALESCPPVPGFKPGAGYRGRPGPCLGVQVVGHYRRSTGLVHNGRRGCRSKRGLRSGSSTKERGLVPKALDETWKMLDDFADASRALAQLGNGGDVAEALCGLALKVVGGDHASITSIRGGKFTTVAATSHVPEQADKIQYATGQGPCLDAIREQDTVRVEDLRTDPRWPLFGAQAAEELGMRSMLAHVLPVDDHMLGAVNVYSAHPNAFTPEHETLIAIVGATAVQALGAAQHQQKINDLEQALHTSRHIGVALGILMCSHRVGLDESWAMLAKASQDRNIKVAALAERVITTGSLDHSW